MISVVIITSLLVVLGWAFNIPSLKSIHPEWVTMKPLTSICFLLNGASYFLLFRPRSNGKTDVTVVVLSFMCFGLTLSALLAAFLQVPELTSRFFPPDKDFQTPVLGTPSIATMFLFFTSSFTSMCFLFQDLKEKAMFWGGFALSLGALSSLLGYLTDSPLLYYYVPGKSTGMAVHTSILFLLMGVKLLKESRRSTFIKPRL